MWEGDKTTQQPKITEQNKKKLSTPYCSVSRDRTGHEPTRWENKGYHITSYRKHEAANAPIGLTQLSRQQRKKIETRLPCHTWSGHHELREVMTGMYC